MDQAFRFNRLQIQSPVPRLLGAVIGPAVCNVKSLANECQFGNL